MPAFERSGTGTVHSSVAVETEVALATSVVVQWLLCLTLCDPMDCSTAGVPVRHYLRVCSNSCPLSH